MNIDKLNAACEKVDKFFEAAKVPALKLPDFLLYCSMITRSGTSNHEACENMFEQSHKRIGTKRGLNSDGSPNMVEGFVFTCFEEYNRERRLNEVIEGVLPSMSLDIIVFGSNAGGTFFARGTNLGSVRMLGRPCC